MSFNPASPLTLSYKQYSAERPGAIVTFDSTLQEAETDEITVVLVNQPNWLSIESMTSTVTPEGDRFGRFRLTINKNVANSLTPGTKSALVTVRQAAWMNELQEYRTTDVGQYRVILELEETILLSVTPTQLSFSYQVGDPAPALQPISIRSEGNWTILPEASYITLSSSSGNDSSTVDVGVDVAGLSFGIYNSLIKIDDGTREVEIEVTLVVAEIETVEEYLYVNPKKIEFLSEFGVVNNNTKILSVDAGADWTALINESWITLSEESGDSGIQEISCGVNSAGLSKGVYQGSVRFNAAGIIKTVYVVLRVVEKLLEGIVSNNLYFAEDRNELLVGSVLQNSFLTLDITASSKEQTFIYSKRQPFFRGQAKSIIGTETETIMPRLEPPKNFNSRTFKGVSAVNFGIFAYEEQFFNGQFAELARFENVEFLRGSAPEIANYLSYMPNQIVLSEKGVIAMHILSNVSPGNLIVTGDIETEIPGTTTGTNKAYSFIFNLSDYELKHGDQLTLTYGEHQVFVAVKTDYIDHHLISFENEWGCFEIIEARGTLTQAKSVKRTVREKAINGKEQTVIVKIESGQDYTIDFGLLYSLKEVEWVSRILSSKRVYLYRNGIPVEITPTSSKLQLYKSRDHILGATLNFKSAVV